VNGVYPQLPILLVDDEINWLESFSLTLEYHCGINNLIKCSDSSIVMELLGKHQLSMVVLDLTMPPPTGEELLPQISANYPDVPIVVFSGLNQLDTAVKCMKLGASDYYTKTSEISHMLSGLKRILKQQELQREMQILKSGLLSTNLQHPQAFEHIVTCNPDMHAIFKYIEAISVSNEPILITGESGTGKELIAKAIHQLNGHDGPFVALNVAGLDENAFSDTLFGHVRGAFTGADSAREGMLAKAAGGILLLDEIGDLPQQAQIKLLRLLQEREYFPLGSDTPRMMDTRIICATNCNLSQVVTRQRTTPFSESGAVQGAFRKDLYYRLSSHQITVPPLRERKEDIQLLLAHFIHEAAQQMGKKVPTYPAQLPVLLQTYTFPGNIRELRAMVYDAVSQHRRGIMALDLFIDAVGLTVKKSGSEPAVMTLDGDDNGAGISSEAAVVFSEKLPTLEQAARQLIDEAMKRAQGNQSLAARMIGISQPALSRRLKNS